MQTAIKKEDLLKIIRPYRQEHLVQYWDELNEDQQIQLARQIQSIDFELMTELYKKKVEHSSSNIDFAIEPSEDFINLKQRSESDAAAHQTGVNAIQNSKVAAFLVAGGDGTRLGYDGPKGVFPITPVKQKSFFQLHAEKIAALNSRYKITIPWYIMTSQTNHQETLDFFHKNNFFGLKQKDVIFFSQQMLPAMHKDGKIILTDKHQIFMSPNGHGGSIKALWDSGALMDMKERGIERVFYFQVDNVLTKICDPVFLGYHLMNKAEISNKVVRKAYPEEKIGVIALIDKKPGVVEYSDLSEEDMYAPGRDGHLKYWMGSIAIHYLNLDFIERLNHHGFKLPYHLARKSIPYISSDGEIINPDHKNGYKFETFVFDALKYADKIISVEVEREEEFSPVKNNEGIDSPLTAQRDMIRQYASWIDAVGVNFPELNSCYESFKIEISPKFALDKEEFISKSSQLKKLKNNIYIE
ncbi:MAG: UDPGP type 1 family protein [Calditrichaceae bacterium]|nr:UDPGP type 1 family protein [Calditrichaceae bacterium]MBN2707863.1 UDPGP type 1 family protein [Calditrichaceae bacterium]RQV94235.1 MAG: UDPGP type 1 family protein [Calditrichota bacterium]